jgi:hypothetical protein
MPNLQIMELFPKKRVCIATNHICAMPYLRLRRASKWEFAAAATPGSMVNKDTRA